VQEAEVRLDPDAAQIWRTYTIFAEISDKESLDSVRLKAAEENPAARRNFAHVLTEIFRPAKRPPTLGDGIGFLKGQRERLKKL